MLSYRTCYKCGRVYNYDEECVCRKKNTIENKVKKQKRDEYLKKYNEENADIIKPLKTQRWRDFRRMIIHRDGGYCQRCKVKFGTITYNNLEVHHIKSRIDYPELIFEEDNCITVCRRCNMDLGTSNKLDFTPEPHTKEDITYTL